MPARKPAKKATAKKAVKKAAKKVSKPLTLKQEQFVEEHFANGGNGTKAARAAGYKGSDNTLAQVARENLRKPQIQEYRRERLKGVKANSDEVLFLLSDHMRADISAFEDCVKEDGGLDLKMARRVGCSHLVKKLKTRTTFTKSGDLVKTTEIEMHDSQSAARTLAEIHGLKQQPRPNQDEIARVNREIARLCGEGWSPEQAKQIVVEACPSAAQYLM